MIEDSGTEFKEQYTKRLLKTAVAFANTDGGDIFIGINDNGVPVGLDNPDDVIRRVTQDIIDSIRPDMTHVYESAFVEMGGKTIIRIRILEGPSKPYYLRDKGIRPEGVLIRAGAMNVPASDDVILKMIREWSSRPFESCTSLEQDLTFEYAETLFKKAGLPFKQEQKKTAITIH